MVGSSVKARFDAQLPEEQKALFERAAMVGGYRSLTEFVFTSAQQKAKEIISSYESLLVSDRDREIFFDAVMNPPTPGDKLRKAAERYRKATSV
ncbi:MAG: DUF1778 domain-containing protein [Emcibacter sp.]|nr:DUF1778 domain-containing protein [Emcibacter sp.]